MSEATEDLQELARAMAEDAERRARSEEEARERQREAYEREMAELAERQRNRLPFRYVCRIDNPLEIIMSGNTDFTANGSFPDGAQFNAAIYKQVEGAIPDGATEKPLLPAHLELEERLKLVLETKAPVIPPGTLIDIFTLKAALAEAAKFLPEPLFVLGAKEKIGQLVGLPEIAEADRKAMLDYLDQKIAESL